ncbi:MAG: hypothetical protein JW860_07730, partial [Sedimentisphaerales bacterium]|nr:hypothetical protein [Sedimentisphaerales bacterium]
LQVTTSGTSSFNVSAITPAADGLDIRNITIEGALTGNIGTAALSFGDVNTLIIQGSDGGGQFFGDSLQGYASTSSTLVLTGVNIEQVDTPNDGTDDLVLIAGSTFNFADATGAAADAFNHHISVGGASGTATIRGIDGDGTLDEFQLGGTGVSGNPIDPADLFLDTEYAMISYILLAGVDGLSTDVSVVEVAGTTSGSWLEFETDIGLVYLTTQLDSISVGIDDGDNVTDDAMLTTIDGNVNPNTAIDRLGTGRSGGAKTGLNSTATSVSDETARLGSLIVDSIGDPGAANINIVVTGDSGPITLTGDTDLTATDDGGFVVNNGAQAAAIAIGGSLTGALTIPGAITGGGAVFEDILIGIAIDGNNDGDFLDAGEQRTSDVDAAITIGDASLTNILVSGDVNADITIPGQDQDLEDAGLELQGSLNGIKAIGNLNNDIIVSEGLDYVIADGVNAADIFSGGDGADAVWIEGTTITGAAVIGGNEGVTSLTIRDHTVAGDLGDQDSVTSGGGSIVLQYTAGAIGATDTLGDIYGIGALVSITVASASGDAIVIGDIYALDNGTVNVSSPSDVGVVVAADDVTIPSSATLQALITATDVVDAPTALDNASGDNAADLSYNGTITAENAGGVVAEGDVTITADIDGAMGYIVALNGDIDATGDVKAGESIGDIVASGDIEGSFISEGTLAAAATTLATTLSTNFGLSGVPSWFVGGILAEAGDIGLNNNENTNLDLDIVTGNANEAVFTAAGDPTLVQGSAFWTTLAMGTIYVPAGEMAADINVGGAFGGIQVPAGTCFVELTVPYEAAIGRIIAPNFSSSQGDADSSWNTDRVGILIISGENVVSEASPLDTDDLDVSVTGSSTIAVVDGDDITLIGGLASGASMALLGFVDELVVDGAWDGTITSDSAIDEIYVNGNIGSAADLDAFNFYYMEVQDGATIDAAVTDSGTLTKAAPSDTVTMLDDATTQTLYLKGGNRTEAQWEAIFGKVWDVSLVGNGSAALISVEGTPTVQDLNKIANDTKAGRGNSDLSVDGAAHLGTVTVALGSKLNLKSVVVNGELDVLTAPQGVQNLWVSDDAGDISIGKSLNKAFIGGWVSDLSANIAKNVTVMDGAGTVTAYKMMNSAVHGTTGTLNIGSSFDNGVRIRTNGALINSIFDDVTTVNVARSIRSIVGE